MHGCPLALLSEASLKSFDENWLLKIHQKTQFWLYWSSGTAEGQEAGKAGVHLCPGSGNIPDVTQCTAAQAHYKEMLKDLPLHLWAVGLFSGNIQETRRKSERNKKKKKCLFENKCFAYALQKTSARVMVWYAIFLLTFFPLCWHDVSLSNP